MVTTVDQIAVELGRATPDAQSVTYTQWGQWIEDVHTQIRIRLGDVTLLDQDTLDLVVRLAVAEHARNPEGWDSRDVSIDDGRESYRYKHSSGRIVIRDEWWAWLDPATTASVFSVEFVGEPDTQLTWPPYVVSS